MKTDLSEILRSKIAEHLAANNLSQNKFAKAAGIEQAVLSRFLKGQQAGMSGDAMSKALTALNATITFNDPATAVQDNSRDVCWVDAKVVPAGRDCEMKPAEEDYLAVPLVEEVGAGPGIIPQGKLLSWFLVWRYQASVMHKRDLIAVMIGEHSTSMVPTLRPKDIVLVDRQDTDVSHPGRIMLVVDPDGAGMIKRVSTKQTRDKDWQITFYSDNTATNPPVMYSLREDYGGDWRKAIAGHVVWAWSDMEGR